MTIVEKLLIGCIVALVFYAGGKLAIREFSGSKPAITQPSK